MVISQLPNLDRVYWNHHTKRRGKSIKKIYIIITDIYMIN
jgi:hypothetical protein